MANVQTMYRALCEARQAGLPYCWVSTRTMANTGAARVPAIAA